MSEEGNMSVEAEASADQATAQAPQSEQSHDDSQAEAHERRKRNDAEYNWAEARKKMQELEKQNLEMREHLSRISQPKAAPEEDELSKLAEDDILTVAQARKLATKMARSVAEDVVKQREAATVEERLQLKYPDYAETVTKENIELLKQTEPELAMSLYSMSHDPHAQAVAAYKLLKKVAVKQDAPNSLEKKRAAENSQKPVSVQSATKSSAIGNAHLFENGITPELKTQLWKEMQQAMKGA